MTIRRKLIAVVAALALPSTAIAALITTYPLTASASAGIAQSPGARASLNPSLKRSPKPKPAGKLRLIKSGAEVSLTQEQAGRQETRQALPPPPPKVSESKANDSDWDSMLRTPPKDSRTAAFRLNIGVCGLTAGDGTVPGPNRCQPVGPEETVVPTPGVVRERIPRPQDVAWEQVLEESRNVVFPGLSVKVQPTGRTLVNLDTIVYTDESKVSTTQVSILGFPVDVEATPMSYVWSFGDGTTLTTATPGKPYPAKEITHKYLKRGGVNLTLTTNYAARFRVAGGTWQYVDGTVPITGPATPLLIREAVPVLVDPGR